VSSTAFTPFRSCYYLLYQCLVPNPREGLSLLVQHCNVPDDFERNILSGGIPRLCNQGILNYLLIVLRKDKEFLKFWNVLKLLTDQSELRNVVERVQKGMTNVCKYVCTCTQMCAYTGNMWIPARVHQYMLDSVGAGKSICLYVHTVHMYQIQWHSKHWCSHSLIKMRNLSLSMKRKWYLQKTNILIKLSQYLLHTLTWQSGVPYLLCFVARKYLSIR